MRKTRILLVSLIPSSFVIKDIQILSTHFDVKTVDFILNKRNLLGTYRTIYNMIIGVLWADVIFSWFINIHAYWAIRLSKIFAKKSIVVIGGFEVAEVPEIGYGAMLNPRLTRIVKYVINNADIVLTVDESLKMDAIRNLGVDAKNIKTVHTGYDYTIFKPEGEKEDLVITVGYITDVVIKRKGFDTFVKTAKNLPNIKFVLIGKPLDDSIEYLRKIAPQNVQFVGFLSNEELIRYYQRAKVYCQLSIYEGLPNALCEAMLCECVPVGTKSCGIPTAIGDTGFYVPYGDPKATANAIKEALESGKGKEARERIKNMFPTEKREKELHEIIRRLLQ